MRVRLPCSSPRRSPLAWVKLIESVEEDATDGFGYHGPIYPPGSTIEIERPGIAVECAGMADKRKGPQQREYLYLLWRWQVATSKWEEIARSLSTSCGWAVEFRPIALRLLDEMRGPRLEPDLEAIARRIEDFLDRELRQLPKSSQSAVLALAHDAFAGRLAAARARIISA